MPNDSKPSIGYTIEIDALLDLLIDHHESWRPEMTHIVARSALVLLLEHIREQGLESTHIIIDAELRAELMRGYEEAFTEYSGPRADLCAVRRIQMPRFLLSFDLPIVTLFVRRLAERMRLKHDTLYEHVKRIIEPLPLTGA